MYAHIDINRGTHNILSFHSCFFFLFLFQNLDHFIARTPKLNKIKNVRKFTHAKCIKAFLRRNNKKNNVIRCMQFKLIMFRGTQQVGNVYGIFLILLFILIHVCFKNNQLLFYFVYCKEININESNF